jgi:hypothetical protein
LEENEKKPMTTLPPNVELNILKLLTTYLLYERGEETELRTAFQALVFERHNQFHTNHKATVTDAAEKMVDWVDCANEVCRAAKNIMDNARKQEVELVPLSIELMRQYGVAYRPTPNGGCTAKLMRKDEVRTFRPPEMGKIIIPGGRG